MSELKLSKTRLRHGRYEAIVEGASSGARPEIEARHQDQIIDGIVLSERETEGEWDLVVPVPADAVADGVQTVVIYAAGTDHKLGEVTLIAGDAAGDDLRAEVELLRAELDMLKRAFRRHCLETM
jgi:hypothetical protein